MSFFWRYSLYVKFFENGRIYLVGQNVTYGLLTYFYLKINNILRIFVIMRIYNSEYRTIKYCLIIFLSMILLTGCHTVKPASVPKPTDGFYSGDFAGVISPETEQHICSYSYALEQLTGSQIVIVTVSGLDGIAIDRYASDIFNSWGIGSSKENNGVLLLMAVSEEQYWIIQGSGLEEYLSSAVLKSMLNEFLEPNFANGDYDGGAKNMFDALYSKLCSYYSVVPQTDSSSGGYDSSQKSVSNIFINIFLACAIFIIVISLLRLILKGQLRRSRRRRGRRRTVRRYGANTACPSNRALKLERKQNSVRELGAIRGPDRRISHSGTKTEKIRNSDDFSHRSENGRRMNRR